jgi:hypothetical protein
VSFENNSSWPGRSAKRVFALDVPAIHVFPVAEFFKTWMPGIKPGMTSNYLAISF